MTLTTHAITGAAIASFFPGHPVLAFSLGFGSHFLLDTIPHADYKILSDSINPDIGDKTKFDKLFFLDILRIGTDCFLGIILSLILYSSPILFWAVLWGAIGGIVPDFLQFVYTKFRHEPLLSLQRFHQYIHTDIRFKNNLVFGWTTQIVFVLVVISLSFYLHSF
ncbi:MAG: hypothetical protein PHS95_00665 [Candidatus Pacebacteria bacterium]|nr:hypothetical protein [Candidatus Paceibacterota bacterium]